MHSEFEFVTFWYLIPQQIRPIDKKLQYQVQKLTRFAGNAPEKVRSDRRESNASKETEDLLKYRPNPDMLASKLDQANQVIGNIIVVFTWVCLDVY